MSSSVDLPRLIRYLEGECSSAEERFVNEWLAGRSDRRELLESLRRRLTGQHDLAALIDVSGGWKTMQARIDGVMPIARRPSDHRRWIFAQPRVALPVGIAALLLIAVSLTIWKPWEARSQAKAPPTFRELARTRPGERARLRLPDGTRVFLGVASQLRVATAYGDCSAMAALRNHSPCIRAVSLDGIAYFDVQHDAQHPFVVHTAHGIAEDIGTAFVVRSYETDSATQVVVTHGLVALRDGDARRALLSPGDLGRLDARGILSTAHRVSVDRYTAFLMGRLVFDDVPLRKAIPDLERWYDITVTLTDPTLALTRVTTSFEHESVDEALSILAGMLNVHATRTGRQVTLSPL